MDVQASISVPFLTQNLEFRQIKGNEDAIPIGFLFFLFTGRADLARLGSPVLGVGF